MKREIEVIYDTSALIELIGTGGNRKRVEDAFIDEHVGNCIPSVVLAEFVSKLLREGENPSRFVGVLEQNSLVLPLNGEIAKTAGRLHAELKKKEPGISLMDCIIMSHGKARKARIMTKDRHFRHYNHVEILH